MAGNVGVQSSAIVVQGLANDLIKGSFKKISKGSKFDRFKWNYIEFVDYWFWTNRNQPIEMSPTISVSMIFVIIVAVLLEQQHKSYLIN